MSYTTDIEVGDVKAAFTTRYDTRWQWDSDDRRATANKIGVIDDDDECCDITDINRVDGDVVDDGSGSEHINAALSTICCFNDVGFVDAE